MKQDKAELSSSGTEEIAPNAKRLVGALRQIGYSLEQALTDILDNSVNAEADSVIVRFVTEKGMISSIVIADNGFGMSQDGLRNAMKFGSNESSTKSLGKYGMGLKLASLSYAKSLTVVTNNGQEIAARKWTIDGLEKGWDCEVINHQEAEKYYYSRRYPFDISKSGTLLIWENIDKLSIPKGDLEKALKKIRISLSRHFGIAFHRFIEDGRLKIFIDTQEVGESYHDIHFRVDPVNPFGYPQTGHNDFPKMLEADIGGVGRLAFDAHIWPPNMSIEEYKLGGKANQKQGFYFYRNDRLIQAGGWNGIGESLDPHMSLARVMIDLPAEYDHEFGLNVQKSKVIVPPTFSSDMQKAKASDGDTFKRYRAKADTVYRRKDERAEKHLPAIPGSGVPISISNKAADILCDERGEGKFVNFEWRHFESSDVFWIDLKESIIYLNKAYRKSLLRGESASGTDLPAFKVLIFFHTKKYFNKVRLSPEAKEELFDINILLSQAVKLGKG